MLEDGAVAVKRLTTYMHETQFKREVECLMKARHKNIVRFLGYCSDTQGIAETFNGNFVIADVQQRLLCFEYLSEGSLHDYITTGRIMCLSIFIFDSSDYTSVKHMPLIIGVSSTILSTQRLRAVYKYLK